MDPTKVPSAAPKLSKQPSNPIFISPSKGGPTHSKNVAPPSNARPMARSMPVMRYVPPAAPTNRPRVANCEPPPMALPPSPPVFSELDVQRELDKRAQQQMAPLSRSLNEYHFAKLSTSAPPTSHAPIMLSTSGGKDNFVFGITPKNFTPAFTPAFAALEENALAESEELDTPNEAKQSSSYSEPSTIFSMLRSSSMSSTAPIHLALDSSKGSSTASSERGSGISTTGGYNMGILNPTGTATGLLNPSGPSSSSSTTVASGFLAPGAPAFGQSSHHSHDAVDDVFQFSISLDQNDDNYMHDEEQDAADHSKYSLAFRD